MKKPISIRVIKVNGYKHIRFVEFENNVRIFTNVLCTLDEFINRQNSDWKFVRKFKDLYLMFIEHNVSKSTLQIYSDYYLKFIKK